VKKNTLVEKCMIAKMSLNYLQFYSKGNFHNCIDWDDRQDDCCALHNVCILPAWRLELSEFFLKLEHSIFCNNFELAYWQDNQCCRKKLFFKTKLPLGQCNTVSFPGVLVSWVSGQSKFRNPKPTSILIRVYLIAKFRAWNCNKNNCQLTFCKLIT